MVCGGIALAAVLTGALVLVTGPRDWFVADSPLEQAGFEPSVPPAGADLFEVNGTEITGVRERSSRFRQG